MQKDKLNVVDLFAGAGGLSAGFRQTNKVNVIVAFENNKWAQQTYLKNHKNVKMFGDVTKELDDLTRYLDAHDLKANIVCGGPPCQGFSNANRQKVSFLSTNNELVKAYVKAIELMDPDAFVMENVKMLQSSKHKFFLAKGEEKTISMLGIELKSESVILSKRSELVDSLMKFLKNYNQINTEMLEKYKITDDKFFSKISHLVRKEKQFAEYADRGKTYLFSQLNKWDSFHQTDWNDNYTELWLNLKENFQDYFNGNFSLEAQIIDSLKEIIEVQKLLNKMCEIVQKQIDFEYCEPSLMEVFIKVKTYGVLDYLKESFTQLGYVFNNEREELILNAADFGAPQVRERLFIIGVKKEKLNENKMNIVTLPKAIITKENRYTVKNAIEDLRHIEPETIMNSDLKIKPERKSTNLLSRYLNANTNELHNHICTETTEIALERFKKIDEGKNFHHLAEKMKTTYSNPNRTQNTVYLRLKYNEPSGTVVNVRKSMWIHPREDRAISIREAARLQTFQDNFVFVGPKDAQYQQVGNAVPPLLGRAVAEHVLFLLGMEPEEELVHIIVPKTASLV
ncbi:DNA cytosine methyltransferase [Paenibacillus luteus]|uniref:DNA cytosine methyltransferase n=1 Tax=Paenibacillus luteus TaxID=2545753 RepID=UPI0011423BED|nr:DNA cytosine methyltransferase [Paenibacillus luteus]